MISKLLKNNFANKKFKVGVLVIIQISIIIVSFLVISQFTIQTEYLGNSINLSGSNRFLGELLFENTEQYLRGGEQELPYDIINTIDVNIYLLKNGSIPQNDLEVVEYQSIVDHTKIMPIPPSLNPEFNELELSWQKYKSSILEQFHNNQGQDLQKNLELLFLKSEFIDAANTLTSSMGNFSNQETVMSYYIQISLLFVNISAHLFLLFIIIKIITREEKIQIQTENLESRNEKLIEEMTALLIKKDSIQLTSSLLLHELQETEKMTSEHEFVSEQDKVKYFWDNFYKNVLIHVEDLEKSRKKYDDEKSYYEQLNKRFKHGLNLVDGKNKPTIGDYDSSDNTLDKLRDLINSLSESGRISPENNRVLTDVLNRIIDSKLRQSSKP